MEFKKTELRRNRIAPEKATRPDKSERGNASLFRDLRLALNYWEW